MRLDRCAPSVFMPEVGVPLLRDLHRATDYEVIYSEAKRRAEVEAHRIPASMAPPPAREVDLWPEERKRPEERRQKRGDREVAVLALFEQSPMTTVDVQERLGVTWNSARGSVGRLVRKGILVPVFPRAYASPQVFRLSTKAQETRS